MQKQNPCKRDVYRDFNDIAGKGLEPPTLWVYQIVLSVYTGLHKCLILGVFHTQVFSSLPLYPFPKCYKSVIKVLQKCYFLRRIYAYFISRSLVGCGT